MASTQYRPVGFCIYCGASRYDQQRATLAEEHVLPLSLNGNLILPEASCGSCEKAINKAIENPMLRGPFWAARLYLGLRSRGKTKPPKTLPVWVYQSVESDEPGQRIEVPTGEFPSNISLPMFCEPRQLAPELWDETTGQMPGGSWAYIFDPERERNFRRKYRTPSYSTGDVSVAAFTRFIAKVAHGMCVRLKGPETFEPLLRRYITHGDDYYPFQLIGGLIDLSRSNESKSHLHSASCVWELHDGIEYLMCYLRMFQQFGGPTYKAVVGVKPSGNGMAFWRSVPMEPLVPYKPAETGRTAIDDFYLDVPGARIAKVVQYLPPVF